MTDLSNTFSNQWNTFAQKLLIVLIVAALCTVAAHFLPFIKLVENRIFDLRVATLTPSRPQSKEIVVVTVTEETLARLPYRSPLDRRFLSVLLRNLEQKEARLIGIDILFDQPTEPGKDKELRRTLKNLKVPVVVASADVGAGLTERQSAFMAGYLRGVQQGLAYLTEDTTDGTVRSIYVGHQEKDRRMLGFAAALASAAGTEAPNSTTVPLGYRGGPNPDTPPFATYPAHSVALLPASWFAGKIVLIGADLALEDRHRTPFAARAGSRQGGMPGVLIHAHALSQLLEGRSGHRLTTWQEAFIILLFSATGMMLAILKAPIGIRSAAGILGVVTVWIAGFVLYQQAGRLVPLVVPTIAFVTSAGLVTAHLWRQEAAQKRFIRSAFSRYLAPAVIEQLVADPSRLALSGEKRETTFLFTDIAGFSSLTERTEPTVLVQLLNGYLDGACNIVLRHGGTMDKIVGDALHVIFNAPSDQPDHAERAVLCAMELDAFCHSYSTQQVSRGIPFGETRIGVNTGSTVVGNFGGNTRFDYTAHGDAINTVARLESANKYLGTRICVSKTTAEKCERVHFRPIGRLALTGKVENIEAFEPLSEAEADSRKTAYYLRAYRLLENVDPRAAEIFSEMARKYPDDRLVCLHARRLASGESGTTVVVKEQ